MLTEGDMAKVLAFCQRVEALRRTLGERQRDFNSLYSDATGIDLILVGPARDAAAAISDAQTLLADCEGKVREVEISIARLLNGQGLPDAVKALGWSFDGWDDERGWVAWRHGSVQGSPDVEVDRSAEGLLRKLQLRGQEVARHD